MLHRLFAAGGPRRTARLAGVFVLAIVVLAAASFANMQSTEAAKGGNGNGNCSWCRTTPTPTPTPAPTLSAPVFTAQTPPTTATVGTAYSYTFRASGNPAPTYAVYSGSLPSGLWLNATTGLLAGTPTTAGSYSFRVSATNSLGTAVTATLAISVGSSCTVPWWGNVQTSYSMTAGTWYSYAFNANGSPTPTYSLYSGSIPAGMSLSSTGVVSGTPTTAGNYSFQLRSSNSCGSAVSPVITMSVGSSCTAPWWGTVQTTYGMTAGTWSSYTFRASGSPTPTYSLYSGSIPAGMSLSSTGVVSGTPTTAGNYSFQIRASNSCGIALSPVITMSVATATTSALTLQAFPYPFTFDYGQAVSYQFVATGGTQPYTFRWSSGIMPAGLALSQSGLLSGTVLAAPNQDFTFLVGVTDAKGTTKAAMVWIHIR